MSSRHVKNTKRGYWLKRIGWAVLLPILLFFLASLLLFFGGGSGVTEKVESVLAQMWLPLTFIRLGVYIILSYHILPFFIRRAADKSEHQLLRLEQIHQQSQSLEEQYMLEDKLKQISSQLFAFERYLQNRYWLLIALIAFDVIMIQIPYWIR